RGPRCARCWTGSPRRSSGASKSSRPASFRRRGATRRRANRRTASARSPQPRASGSGAAAARNARDVERSVALREWLTAGLAAGIVGAIAMAAFLYVMLLRGVPTQPVLGLPAWAGAGLGLQILVGAAWGVGYGYLARSQPQIVRRPVVSGIVFGIVVYAAMQTLVIIDGAYHRPS